MQLPDVLFLRLFGLGEVLEGIIDGRSFFSAGFATM